MNLSRYEVNAARDGVCNLLFLLDCRIQENRDIGKGTKTLRRERRKLKALYFKLGGTKDQLWWENR